MIVVAAAASRVRPLGSSKRCMPAVRRLFRGVSSAGAADHWTGSQSPAGTSVLEYVVPVAIFVEDVFGLNGPLIME